MEKINWNKQAIDFLKSHGWYKDEVTEIWFHPCFPLGEELPDKAMKEENQRGYYTPYHFVIMFYGRAWESYESYIKSLEILYGKEE